MANGSGLEVYQALLFGSGLSSSGMRGIFKAGIPQSTENGLLNQS